MSKTEPPSEFNEITAHINELLSSKPPEIKSIPNEAEFKQMSGFGNWSIENMNDFLGMTNPVIQSTLRQIPSHLLLNAIFPCSDELKKHFLDNLSGRLRQISIEELKGIAPTKKESAQAQTVLLESATGQLADYELSRWQKLMSKLPDQPLAKEADLSFLLSLNGEKTKLWMDNIHIDQLVHATCLDDEWYELYEQKIEPQFSEPAKKMITNHIFDQKPQFTWEVEIARLLITTIAKSVKHSV